MLNKSPIDPKAFAERLGSWTRTRGPEDDVVVTSRVRLARNLSGFRFRTRIGPDEAQAVCDSMLAALDASPLDGDTHWVGVGETPVLLRLLLRERYLCSRDLAPAGERDDGLPGRAVAFGVGEDLSVMVNEEDHLRLQALAPGLDLEGAMGRVTALDRSLEQLVDFAFTKELGYLTGCPTNVGTGMRASVMLHLPALGMVRAELEKVIRSAQRTGLAVRGIYGEGSRAVGDLYQISNQVTLGRSEEQLVGDLAALIPSILEFERRVRGALLEERGDQLRGRIEAARELLASTRSIDTDSALTALSMARLGDLLGLGTGLGQADFGRLVIQVQKGHVQALGPSDEALEGGEMIAPSLRDSWRAAYLRKLFGH